jgi:3-phenylpropionate/trans-cinnamate dioxygenase ferredoxin reductase component
MRVVIVGSSLAGATAAATLRSEGFDGEILLVGREGRLPYERPPLSKEFLRGEIPFENTLVRPPTFYPEAEIELRLGVAAERLDPRARSVELADGGRVGYDALLVTTGGRTRRVAVAGADLEGVLDLRTVEDAERIRDTATAGGRAVVVGMGFIGSEVAASLTELDVEVTAIEPLEAPLAGVLGRELADVMVSVHRDHGVELLLGEAVEAFEGSTRLERVRTSSGRVVPCELAVVGVGIEPAVELVAGVGVDVDDGILVDARCRTSVDGIFAAGDVARHEHPRLGSVRVEHYDHAIAHGATAARSILGTAEPYAPAYWFWSDQYDVNLQMTGLPGRWEELVVRGSLEERSLVAFYLAGGRVQAAAGLNRGRDVRRAMRLVETQATVPPDLLRDESVDLREIG